MSTLASIKASIIKDLEALNAKLAAINLLEGVDSSEDFATPKAKEASTRLIKRSKATRLIGRREGPYSQCQTVWVPALDQLYQSNRAMDVYELARLIKKGAYPIRSKQPAETVRQGCYKLIEKGYVKATLNDQARITHFQITDAGKQYWKEHLPASLFHTPETLSNN